MYRIILLSIILAGPSFVLAQGSVPDARVTDTPMPADAGGVAATATPVAAPAVTSAVTPRPVLTTAVPMPTPRPTPPISPQLSPQSESLTEDQPDPLPEDWFYKYALTLLGVGGVALLSYGVFKFNKSKQNKNKKDSDGKCGSIRELLEQKKKELEGMIKNWPEEKLKSMAQEKIVGELKKDEDAKKIIETFENLKAKHDQLKKTIEALQKKYDLCMLELPNVGGKYTMRIVEGSLLDPKSLDQFNPKKLEYFDDKWKNLLGVDLDLGSIKETQKIMTKHYEGPEPWYMDGHLVGDPDEIICAFGADDGEGGRIFKFRRDDKKAFQEAKEYALSRGIPEEEFDFLN
ncbi:MAG: hypothetical protein Q7S43_03245 [bacterium]|nr:hypothetical protein [bacterium]MDO8496444.1 hypothetical protein [bacterium]